MVVQVRRRILPVIHDRVFGNHATVNLSIEALFVTSSILDLMNLVRTRFKFVLAMFLIGRRWHKQRVGTELEPWSQEFNPQSVNTLLVRWINGTTLDRKGKNAVCIHMDGSVTGVHKTHVRSEQTAVWLGQRGQIQFSGKGMLHGNLIESSMLFLGLVHASLHRRAPFLASMGGTILDFCHKSSCTNGTLVGSSPCETAVVQTLEVVFFSQFLPLAIHAVSDTTPFNVLLSQPLNYHRNGHGGILLNQLQYFLTSISVDARNRVAMNDTQNRLVKGELVALSTQSLIPTCWTGSKTRFRHDQFILGQLGNFFGNGF
mmetsp:Transcript_39358/g.95254  ORF Transcript_39358/g.95254 Transcript_39358/m.95254 type:complete len:316 (-) Transcript_39358:2524-3471(-)